MVVWPPLPVTGKRIDKGRHRTVRMKGALSRDTGRLMVFKLVMAAANRWRRLQGKNQLPKVISGVPFLDGIEVAVVAKSAA